MLRFNLPAAAAHYAELSEILAPGCNGSDEARASAFVAWLTDLKHELGIPATLSAYRAARPVTGDDIAKLTEIAVADICHNTNPRPCTAEDFRQIFAAAM